MGEIPSGNTNEKFQTVGRKRDRDEMSPLPQNAEKTRRVTQQEFVAYLGRKDCNVALTNPDIVLSDLNNQFRVNPLKISESGHQSKNICR